MPAMAAGRMYRLRMRRTPIQRTLCSVPAGIHSARVLGTTQWPWPERTTIRPETA
ncbi:hypothetical protein NB689_003572 [Xanthomonas sacchari]|nr:hypothetical protein [Xanthomonas sacchari]